MAPNPKQSEQWSGEFGRQYTDRNPHTPAAMDELHLHNFGVTRTALNREFLADLDPASRILEVGANVGAQLALLRDLGFHRLYGVELQFYAIQQSREHAPGLHLVQASAFDLPFPDRSFDLVFTSGVLIHLSPETIGRALDEIRRCTRRYIWGWEYFAEEYRQIPYRGHEDLLWKGDFAAMYRERFPGLRCAKEKRVPYLEGGNVDTMFLLEAGAD
ncbi:MAG: methyltransferase domain-containing protein [Candidatus Hydrogenedentes bacterium]|nr:methyltransferase domain-containing protein [Candidatus Hydrogenedentota bacterium]